ncbi:MAG TPA: iron-sulfur cluster carrier protein ApbC [Mariprofundaceae bacterium]|nr:iron-sulfur cluster carrier protein ApbC [Mariprofundaceae bacterium]
MAISEAQVQSVLKQLVDPNTTKDFIATRSVKNIKIAGDDVSLDVELGYPGKSQFEPIRRQVVQALKQAGAAGVSVNIRSRVVPHAVQRGVKLIPGIKNIIAVASGKGGVGKSTTAVNLAVALAQTGARTGLLDADIYGPSVPSMMGLGGRRPQVEENTMLPLANFGVLTMSIGYLIDEDQAVIWRGPMVSSALMQLLTDVRWGELDYLIVDMPPGTGDIQLTLAQKIPVTGAVVVTTPQDIALLDCRRGIEMFKKVQVPTLGIVENMHVFICPHCGEASHIFAEGGAEKLAATYQTDIVARVPLDIRIREDGDAGTPIVAAHPDSEQAAIYRDMAGAVARKISVLNRRKIEIPVVAA